MAVVRGFMSKTMLQIPMLKTIQWKFMTVRCASGPKRPDITHGPPAQTNGTPKTKAVTDEDRPGGITTGPPPQTNQVPQKIGVTTDEEEQNGANGSNQKPIPAQVLTNL
ncbi:unnamed protein product [Prunus brigantina]